MAGKKGYFDETHVSETGNWNVASDYSKSKIMKHLYYADEYETIATFGAVDFFEELQINFDPDSLRIRAFRRLIKTLIMLIDNSKFAIKKSGDKKKLEDYRKELDRFYKIVPKLCKVKKNNIKKTSELKIIPEIYNPILERTVEIKSLINDPLNASDLLFLNKDEFDPRKFKKELLEKITTQG